jgi:phage shock protein C
LHKNGVKYAMKTKVEKTKKLYRVEKGKIVFGVCAGLAEYMDLEATLVRLVFLILFFAGGSGFFVYLIVALLMPKKNQRKMEIDEKIKNLAMETRDRAKFFGKEIVNERQKKGNGQLLMGAMIVVFGLSIIAKKLIPGWWEEMFWPTILIVMGMYLIFKK